MRTAILAAAVLCSAILPLRAETLVADNYGNHILGGPFDPGGGIGQQFTTGLSGSFNNITFNFYTSSHPIQPPGPIPVADPSYPFDPYATGTAYLLSSPYTGLPGNLSASTPGFIASTLAVNNVYAFGPSVVLQSGQFYYLYGIGNISSNVLYFSSGQEAFYSFDPQMKFETTVPANDYLLTGTQVTPEPPALLLAGTGLLFLAFFFKRRHPAPATLP